MKEVLQRDLTPAVAAIPDLEAGIVHCEKVGDFVSRELIVDTFGSEEEDVDWLETNCGLIEKMGLQNHLQSQSEPAQSWTASIAPADQRVIGATPTYRNVRNSPVWTSCNRPKLWQATCRSLIVAILIKYKQNQRLSVTNFCLIGQIFPIRANFDRQFLPQRAILAQ